jgi:hypothetical protein
MIPLDRAQSLRPPLLLLTSVLTTATRGSVASLDSIVLGAKVNAFKLKVLSSSKLQELQVLELERSSCTTVLAEVLFKRSD